MSECLMVLAYLPWIRLHADRFLGQLQRARKGRSERQNRQSGWWDHGDTEWVSSE